MKKADREKFRYSLLQLQARLRGEVQTASARTHTGPGSQKDPAGAAAMTEEGSDAWSQHFSLRSAGSEAETLAEIAAALDRIDDGTFGLCQGCVEGGKSASKCAIARTRLNAIPYARNCIECERRREDMV